METRTSPILVIINTLYIHTCKNEEIKKLMEPLTASKFHSFIIHVWRSCIKKTISIFVTQFFNMDFQSAVSKSKLSINSHNSSDNIGQALLIISLTSFNKVWKWVKNIRTFASYLVGNSIWNHNSQFGTLKKLHPNLK